MVGACFVTTTDAQLGKLTGHKNRFMPFDHNLLQFRLQLAIQFINKQG